MFYSKKMIIAGDYVHLYEYNQEFRYGYTKDTFKKDEVVKKDIKKLEREKRDTHIYRIRRNVKFLLQSNISSNLPIFITLTFKKNICDLKSANYEYDIFLKRFNYRIYGYKCSKLKYLVVPEFQKRGAVHYHVIFFNLPYINNLFNIVSDVWGSGFVFISSIKDVSHLCNYVSKYFTKRGYDRRMIGQKAYFCSRNLVRPREIKDDKYIDLFKNKLSTVQYSKRYIIKERDLVVDYSLYKNIGIWI